MPRRMIYNTGAIAPTNLIQTQFQSDDKGHLKVNSGSGFVVDFAPTLDTNIYANNDVLFISTTLGNVADQEGGYVKLVSAVLFDGDDQGTDVDVYFTTNSTTPGTINAALSAADTVFDDIVGAISFTSFNDLINSQNSVLSGINQVMKCAAGTQALYAFGVVRSGTPTYTAAGMTFKFGFERI